MDDKIRSKSIFKTSIIGIITNMMIAIIKVIIGTLSGSIAIVSDGINNFSDAGSSLITIIGNGLSNKPADKKHPLGYGRIEYLSSLFIAIIILYAGATSLIESIKAIIHPEKPDYSIIMIIIGVVVFIKLALAIFTIKQGKKVDSDALKASGKEAIFDVLVSVSTLIAALVYVIWNVSLEAYLGAIISLLIIKAGLESLLQTASKIIGEPGQVDIVKNVKKTVIGFEGVNGAYDLVLHNYGHNRYAASIHIEVNENMTAVQIDDVSRKIIDKVLQEHGVYLTAVGIYSKNTSNKEIIAMEKDIKEWILKKEHVIAIHGFYVDLISKLLRFDVVISLNSKNRREVYDNIIQELNKMYKDYNIVIGLDIDYNELDS